MHDVSVSRHEMLEFMQGIPYGLHEQIHPLHGPFTVLQRLLVMGHPESFPVNSFEGDSRNGTPLW